MRVQEPTKQERKEPIFSQSWVDNTTPKAKSNFKRKPKPTPLVRICERCRNIISNDGYCEFCNTQNEHRVFKANPLPL